MSATSHDAARLHDILSRTLGLLDRANTIVAQAGVHPPEDMVRMLDRASSEIREARRALDEATPPESSRVVVQPAVAGAAPARETLAAPLPARKRWRIWRWRRKAFVVTRAGDIGRLVIRLLLPWWLPRIEMGALDMLTLQQVQRAQHTIRHRQAASDRMVAGPVLAAFTVMAGTFYIVWRWNWDFQDLARVGMAAVAAWVVGNLLNLAWCRFRLLLSLLALLFRIRAARG
jgi:hypothetical protein